MPLTEDNISSCDDLYLELIQGIISSSEKLSLFKMISIIDLLVYKLMDEKGYNIRENHIKFTITNSKSVSKSIFLRGTSAG